MLENIIAEYPRSEFDKYGDWIELRFRIEQGEGCYKVAGTIDQVKKYVEILILKHNYKQNG